MGAAAVAFVIALAWVLVGCSSAEPGLQDKSASAPEELSDVERIRARGRLIMLAWPHQESTFVRRMVKEYGEEGLHRFGGIDVELLERFADELGVRLEVKPVQEGFAQLIPSLLAGEGDLIASSMTITKARTQQVDFSDSYHSVDLVVLLPTGSTARSVEDLLGKKAATVRGSSHEEHLHEFGFDDDHLVFVEFTLENYQAVAYGNADVTLVDSGSADTVLPQYAALRERLKVGFDSPVRDHYGIAVRPGSDLLGPLNAFLAREKAAGRLPEL
jgi:ABC-type amino acid transport substrate-binding protein